MSSSKSLSAIDLLSQNVAIGWPEAVAVVLEIAERVSRGALVGVPALSDIAIDSRGAVLSSGTTSSDDLPVRRLARLLAGLLGGSSPVPELGQLIAANVAKPPALGSVAEFQRALAFFERPGRQELLAQLFERAADAVAAAKMHREVERLRAQQRADQQPENKRKPAPPKRRLTAPLAMTAALVLAAAAGAGVWLCWPAHRPVTTHANASAPDPHVIFDATSADVAPPTIKRPQLPERTVDTSALDTGMLELLVNEAGEVDKVKLVSPSNRFEDRMIVAAAKAWRFTPAEKDGRPVRYRLRVALTW